MFLKLANCNNRGFTIIEVLITMAIFSIGFLGVARLQISSVYGNRNTFNMSEVLSLAEGRMEELISAPFNSLIDTTGDGSNGLDATTAAAADNTATTPDGRYTIFWNVADNFPGTNTKTIKVTIVWNRGSKKLSFTYIKAS